MQWLFTVSSFLILWMQPVFCFQILTPMRLSSTWTARRESLDYQIPGITFATVPLVAIVESSEASSWVQLLFQIPTLKYPPVHFKYPPENAHNRVYMYLVSFAVAVSKDLQVHAGTCTIVMARCSWRKGVQCTPYADWQLHVIDRLTEKASKWKRFEPGYLKR